jgi:preprotein translocase subunit SecG
MSFLYFFAFFLFMLVAALLCLVILIQENKSMGLGASFGGDAGSSLFGTSTASIVKKITAWLATLFFIGCILLSLWTQAIGGFQKPSIYPDPTDDEMVG